MEKEKKGLFARFLDFWTEASDREQSERIGFREDPKTVENHFAETGAVVSLTQQEMKQSFWKETAETFRNERMENRDFFAEEKRVERTDRPGGIFRTEPQQEKQNTESPFLWEQPEGNTEKEIIIPVEEETEQKKEPAEEEQNPLTERILKQEAPQREDGIDVDRLMRQITKKLWEERESCGRRLR